MLSGRTRRSNRFAFQRLLALVTSVLCVVSLNPIAAAQAQVGSYQPPARSQHQAPAAPTPHLVPSDINATHSRVMSATPISRVNTLQGAAAAINLDLTSANQNIVLTNNLFRHDTSATINVGGSNLTYLPGSTVTAAQYVAVQQVLAGLVQTLTIAGNGAASGGSFKLNGIVTRRVNDLVIPAGVIGFDDFGSQPKLVLSGDLINFGSLIGTSAHKTMRSGIILSSSISNNDGALISTTSPHLDLTLMTLNGINNAGAITSAGSLTLAPGSGVLNNSGEVISKHGDVTISTGTRTNLVVNSTGTIEAAGNINVRTPNYSGTASTSLNGGDYLSTNLNVYGGNGAINGNVGNVSGVLNTYGQAAHFFANTPNLTLGNNCLKGDPTFANSGGNIDLTGTITAAESIAILAAGNISIPSSADVSISTQESGGSVYLIAGATVSTTGSTTGSVPPLNSDIGAGQTATVDFNSGTGGNIDLATNNTHTGSPVIDTSSTTGSAGSVTLAAFANGAVGGQVAVADPGAGVPSIKATSTAGSGGAVTILAGAIGGQAITTGGIQTSGVVGSGEVVIGTYKPASSSFTNQIQFNDTGVPSDPVIATGSLNSADVTITGDIVTAGAGGIFTGSNGVNGADIVVESGKDVTISGNVLSYGGGGAGGSGSNNDGVPGDDGGAGGSGGHVRVQAGTSLSISGDINTSGGGGGGGGGGLSDVFGDTAGGAGGAGGASNGIELVVQEGTVQVSGTMYQNDGGAGGAGGAGHFDSVFYNGGGGGGGGGSFGGGGGAGGGGVGSQFLVATFNNGVGGGGGAGYFNTSLPPYLSASGGGGGGGNDLTQNLNGGGGGFFGAGLGGVGGPGGTGNAGGAGVGGNGGKYGALVPGSGGTNNGAGGGSNGGTGGQAGSNDIFSPAGTGGSASAAAGIGGLIVGNNVTLEGLIRFSGQNLAVLSTNSINALPGTWIDLSSSTANGGNLYMIAGFSFTPSVSGQHGPPPDPFTTYTLDAFSSSTGSINGSELRIKTATTFNSLGSLGGDVVMVANGGSIDVKSIDTSSQFGVAGSATLIGEGVTENGITARGGFASGSAVLIAATPTQVGTVTVNSNGTVTNGFLPGLGAGNVTVSGPIDAGLGAASATANNGSVILNSGITAGGIVLNGQNGISTGALNFLAAPVVLLQSAGGTIGSSVSVPVRMDVTGALTANAGLDVFLQNNTAGVTHLTDNGPVVNSAGGTYSLQATNAIVTDFGKQVSAPTISLTSDRSDISVTIDQSTAHSVTLAASRGGVMILGSILTVAPDGSGNGGTINIVATTIAGSVPGAVTLNANGSGGSGAGGQISITNNTTAVDTDLILNAIPSGNVSSASTIILNYTRGGIKFGPGAGTGTRIDINAPGGPTGGPGAFLTATAYGDITVNPGGLIIGPSGVGDGSGALIFLTAGTSSAGTIAINDNLSANSSGTAGAQSILLTAPTVSIGSGIAVTANGSSGGTINITTDNLLIGGAGIAAITANGISNAGQVTITQTGQSPITLGNALGNLQLSATGTGNGAIRFSTGGDLFVNPGAIDSVATGNGGGAIVALTAGTTGAGTLALTTNILANGSGSGSGNSISLRAPVLAITGTITLSSSASLAGSGGGGAVTVNADSFSPAPGDMLILKANAGGGGSAAGGTIAFSQTNGGNLSLGNGGSDNLQATANGGGTGGDGGSVTISTGGNITANLGGVTVDTTPGFNGNGGKINLTAGAGGTGNGFLTVNNQLDASGSGTGNGGTINLQGTALTFGGGGLLSASSGPAAGSGATGGTITVRGTSLAAAVAPLLIAARGQGSASGGIVDLQISGSTNLNLGTALGSIKIDATGGPTGGAGGKVTVFTGGNLTVTPAGLLAQPQGGNSSGAVISLAAGLGAQGTLTLAGPINAAALGTASGGSILLIASTVQYGDGVFLFANADSGGSGQGGQITIRTGTFDSTATVNPLVMNASGSNIGGGGAITISISKNGLTGTGDVVLGSNAGNLQLFAQSGVNGGNGGFVNVISFADVTLGTGGISANPLFDGNGANVTLQADTAGNGTLTLLTGISATGAGSGRGGIIDLKAANIAYQGAILLQANAGAGGNTGGTISMLSSALTDLTPGSSNLQLRSNGTGGQRGGDINVTVAGSVAQTLGIAVGQIDIATNGGAVTVSTGGDLTVITQPAIAPSSGDGGQLTLHAGESGIGTLFIKTSLDAKAITAGDGGLIDLAAPTISYDDGTVINASADTNGTGGFISITTANLINAGLPTQPLQLNAFGVTAGSGGEVLLSFRGASTITLGNAAGEISINAASGGGGSGVGGTIAVNNSDSIIFNGGIDATGGTAGGPTITLAAGTTGIGTLTLNSNLNADGVGGSMGGTINLSAPVIEYVNGEVISADGGTSGAGGQIFVQAGVLNNISVIPASPLSVHADGNSSANGGFVEVDALTGSLTFGTGAGMVKVTARGATGGGDGGTLNSIAGNNITVETGGIDVGPRVGVGGQASGGNITLVAADQGSGTLTLNTAVHLDSVGDQGGGDLVLVTKQLVVADGIDITSNSDPFGSGPGGGIIITASSITAGPSLPLKISASAGGGGGQITVTVTGTAPVILGNAGGNLQLEATGGTGTFSPDGGGGTIIVQAGGNLTVNSSSVDARPLGTAGSGGTIDLSAGESAAGNLTVNTPLSVAGSGGTAGGGSIFLAGTNLILANNVGLDVGTAGTGTGGTIDLDAASTITLTSNNTLSAVGGSFNSGGSISFDATSLVIGDNVFANADGGAGGNGGFVTTNVTNATHGAGDVFKASGVTGGTLSMNVSNIATTVGADNWFFVANGLGLGSGGSISIGQGTGALVLGGSSGLVLSSQGGGAGGDRGAIGVTYGGDLTINSGGILNNVGPDSGGGSITLSADPNNKAGTFTLNTSLNVHGTGTGSPGTIFIAAPHLVHGAGVSIAASSLGSSTGGTIMIFASDMTGSGTLTLHADTTPNGAAGGQVTFGVQQGNIVIGGGSADLIATANSGTGGGTVAISTAAGSITLNSGGVGVAPVSPAGGNGGLLFLAAPSGNLTLNTNISVDAVQNGSGGQVTVSGATITSGVGRLTISASGAGSGNGGSISYFSGSASPLTIGTGASDDLTLIATGGSANSTTGGGGNVFAQTSGNITVFLNQGGGPGLNANPLGLTGNGGSIGIVAGNTGTGTLDFADTSTLTANATVSGDAGRITLQATSITYLNSATTPLLLQTLGTSGFPSITYDSQGTAPITIGNSGSSVLVDMRGAAGLSQQRNSLTVRTGGDLTFNPGGILTPGFVSPGTVLSLTAGNSSSTGTFTLNTSLSVDSVTSGGAISINAPVISTALSNPTLSAAGGAGSVSLVTGSLVTTGGPYTVFTSANRTSAAAGTLNVQISGSTDLTVGGGGANLLVEATSGARTGGSVTSSASINIVTAGNMTINPGGIINNVLSNDGRGIGLQLSAANISLRDSLSTASFGNFSGSALLLTATKDLSVDAPAALIADGGNGFFTFGGSINASAQNITAPTSFLLRSGGTFFGGFVQLAGSKSVTYSNLVVSADAGFPGQARLTAGDTLSALGPNSVLSVRANGVAGAGAAVISATNVNIQGIASVTATNATSGGGSATLNLANLDLTAATAPLLLNSSGKTSGGSVSMGINGAPITLGGAVGDIKVSASPTGNGNGGNLVIVSTGDVTIDQSGLSLAAAGPIGSGGFITIITPRTLTLLQSLSSAGAGSGPSGQINLTVGTLEIGRSLSFIAQPGPSSLANGGTVTINVNGSVVFGSNTLTISASGGPSGSGGTINFVSKDHNPLIVGGNAPQLLLQAHSGTNGGNAGSISVLTQGALTVDVGAIDATVLSPNGRGPTLSLLAAQTGSTGGSGDLSFGALRWLDVSGNGTGLAGNLTLQGTNVTWNTSATNPFALTARGAGSGHVTVRVLGPNDVNLGTTSGALTIDARGSATSDGATVFVRTGGDLNVSKSGLITQPAARTSGAGGVITLWAGFDNFDGGISSKPTSILSFTDFSRLSADGAGSSGEGGNISLTAGSITYANSATVPLLITADGSGSASGGFISIETSNASSTLTIGSSAGQITLSAASGRDDGDGGGINVFSEGSLIVHQATGLSVAARGSTGRGGSIFLGTDTSTASTITISDATPFSLNGVGIGDGGDIDIESSQVFFPAGNIFMSVNAGSSFGDGGSIFIQSGGNSPLVLGTVGNSLTLAANAGAFGGSGGSVTVRNGGDITVNTGGISVTPASDGNGGNIRLNAGEDPNSGDQKLTGTLTLNTDLNVDSTQFAGFIQLKGSAIRFTNAISVSANSGSTSQGGNIDIHSGTLFGADAASILNVSANGGPEADGGHVQLTVTGNSPLVLGGTGANLTVSALGGGVSGNGGTVIAETGGNMTVNAGGLNLTPQSPNGSGGELDLKAGTSGAGVLTLNAPVSVDGNGTGGGGILFVSTSSLVVSPTSNILLSAKANGTGSGGDVTLQTTNSTSGVTLGNTLGTITTDVSGSNAGSISVNIAGNLTINAGGIIDTATAGDGAHLSLSGNTTTLSTAISANGERGGTISIGANTALKLLGGPILISANGTVGHGGAVTVSAFGKTAAITVGNAAGNLQLSAVNGTGGPDVDAGAVTVLVGGNLTVDPSAISISTAAASGTGVGGAIGLQAGQAAGGTGILKFINGSSLNVDGVRGDGGTVSLIAKTIVVPTTAPFVISANGTAGGDGGVIGISQTSKSAKMSVGTAAGNVQLSARSSATSGQGGTVFITSGSVTAGKLTINTGGIDVSPQASNSNGGSVNVVTGTLVLNSTSASPLINANAIGTAIGGSINVTAGKISVTGTNAALLQAAGTAAGDLIVNATSSGSALTVGTGVGMLQLDNRGTNALLGVTSGGNLTVDTAAIQIGSQTSGVVGSLQLTAGTASASGILKFINTPTLSLNAVGTNGGGTISIGGDKIVSTLSGPLTISANGQTGGSITFGALAKGATLNLAGGPGSFAFSATGVGNGGAVAASAGGNVTFDPAVISANPSGTQGKGASITVVSGGILTIVNNFTISADGVGNANGGLVSLSAATISAAQPLVLNANSGTNGNGGTVTFTVTKSGSAVNIGGGTPGSVTLNAVGNSSPGFAGNGGRAEVSSGGNINVVAAALNLAPNGVSGAGAQIILFAGQAGKGVLNFVDASALSADGIGLAGQGGILSIAAPKLTYFNSATVPFTFSANGTASRSGGQVIVQLSDKATPVTVGTAAGQLQFSVDNGPTSLTSGLLTISSANNLTVNVAGISMATTASAGTLNLIAGTSGKGILNLADTSTLSLDGVGNGNGGNLLLRSPSIVTYLNSASTSLKLSASAAGTGRAGLIQYVVTGKTAPLTIGQGAGQLELTATQTNSNTSGAGTVAVSSGGPMTVNPSGLHLASSGRGTTINLTATNLLVTGSLNVDGATGTQGGLIILNSKSSTPFVIGTPTTNGVQGTLSASGSGNININANGSGGISTTVALSSSADFLFNATGGGGITISNVIDTTVGNGSEVTLSVGTGKVTTTGAGVIKTDFLELSGTKGSFGTKTAALQVVCEELELSSQVFVNVHNQSIGGTFVSMGVIPTKPAGTMIISSDAGIEIDGPLRAGTITLQAGAVGGITSSDTNSVITAATLNLSAPGGSLGSGDDLLQVSSKKLTATTAGSVLIQNIGTATLALGGTVGVGSVSVSSLGAITSNLVDTTSNSIGLAAASGGVSVKGNLGSLANTAVVSLFAGGKGNVSAGSKVVLAAGRVTLQSDTGKIGAIQVNTPAVEANTGGAGTVSVTDVFLGTVTSFNSSSGGTFTLKTTDTNGQLVLNNIQAGNAITVIGAGTLLATAEDAVIQVGQATAKVKTGSILLEASNVSATPGNILIADNTTISTFVSTPSKTNGVIKIVIGKPPAAPVAGTAPIGVTVNQVTTGQAFFGVNGINALSQATINLQGSNVIFSTPTSVPGANIVLQSGTVITADPPSMPIAGQEYSESMEYVVDTDEDELDTFLVQR